MATTRDRRVGIARGLRQDPPLFLFAGIVDQHVEHEPIELRFGQRIGSLLLDRILRGQHEERTIEIEPRAAHGHLVLLHGLEQRGLRLRRGPIDFVREQDVGEDRAADEPDDPAAGRPIFLDHFRTENVGRHQIRRELNAVEPQIHRLRQLLDQERLGQTRNAAQEAMAAGQKGNQDLSDDALLPDDGLRELGLQLCRNLRHPVEIAFAPRPALRFLLTYVHRSESISALHSRPAWTAPARRQQIDTVERREVP